ncbi:hypothetical protein KC19_2G156200 [Ceratodon purpureus]|uniref:ADP-ribosylation factor n=1 Tax=Ceratodon purpureus TaxID=3225 RepID=A0A8T0IUB6_CERPU|nr:hypothetical protein KC19_2G156200 [Ceratodon purpureus]
MGQLIGKLLSSVSWGTKAYGILMVGLDNAGKTTILYKMSMGELVTTIPTIGINIESIKYQNVSFTVWDMGGQDKIRPLWRFYFDNTQALIFVIDSNDKDRITEARDELQQLLKNSELSNAKLLVFANKQDMAKVLTSKEITDWLYLNRLKERDWHVQPCSATTGEGLREGLDWLANALKDNKSSKTTNTTKTNGVGSPQTPRTPRTPR